ncbi:BTB/POZ domain-containing protein 7 isoform X2 [Lampetra fluviatilis]
MGASPSHVHHSFPQRGRINALHHPSNAGISVLAQHQGFSLDSKRAGVGLGGGSGGGGGCGGSGVPGSVGHAMGGGSSGGFGAAASAALSRPGSHERQRSERKRKAAAPSLATLKQKLSRRRRAGRSAHHAKQMRELLSGWALPEVSALVEEYEAAAALKEVAQQASLARPTAHGLRHHLSCLYEYKYCTDMDLIFQDTCFPVHRAILVARCPYFRNRLALPGSAAGGPAGAGGVGTLGYGAELTLTLGAAGVDLHAFSALLRFLYTGELESESDGGDPNAGGSGYAGKQGLLAHDGSTLARLGEEFGTPNALAVDLLALLDSGCYYDAVLCFSSDMDYTAPTRILLDEAVLPRRYGPAVLHCMYTDCLDLALVAPPSSPACGSPVSVGALGELHASACLPSRVEEAMELYGIALFLEFEVMAQGCEDIIADSLSLEVLIPILGWSAQPHGSPWVHRRALHYLCEEFGRVAASPMLCDLSQDYLLSALQSDFLQACEQDVLKAVIKWGEHQLIKRMEDREPNVVSSTAHSVSKKGVKRKDLDSEELRDILSPLLPHVRVDLMLPPNCDVLGGALKRGLISRPPSDMLPSVDERKGNAWMRGRGGGIAVKPRLFTPYVEEAKAVLEEMTDVQTDKERLRWTRVSSVPDTLYMLDGGGMGHHQPRASMAHASPRQPSPSGLLAAVDNQVPVPSQAVVREMLRRVAEARAGPVVRQALSLPCGDIPAINRHVQLRVLREFGLPDSAIDLLQNPYKYFPDSAFDEPESMWGAFGHHQPIHPQYILPHQQQQGPRRQIRSAPSSESLYTGDVADALALSSLRLGLPFPPPPPPYQPPLSRGTQAPSVHDSRGRSRSHAYGGAGKMRASQQAYPDGISCGGYYDGVDTEGSESGVSEPSVPDIAMAASTLSRMSLSEMDWPDARPPAPSCSNSSSSSSVAAAAAAAPPAAKPERGKKRSSASSAKGKDKQELSGCPDLYDFSSSVVHVSLTSAEGGAATPAKYSDPAMPDLHSCHGGNRGRIGAAGGGSGGGATAMSRAALCVDLAAGHPAAGATAAAAAGGLLSCRPHGRLAQEGAAAGAVAPTQEPHSSRASALGLPHLEYDLVQHVGTQVNGASARRPAEPELIEGCPLPQPQGDAAEGGGRRRVAARAARGQRASELAVPAAAHAAAGPLSHRHPRGAAEQPDGGPRDAHPQVCTLIVGGGGGGAALANVSLSKLNTEDGWIGRAPAGPARDALRVLAQSSSVREDAPVC